MNRIEALRILGLDEEATAEDIKIAYRESAQILHPDRFASNKKLQERATEQFKVLQEAYEYLSKGKGGKKGASSRPDGARSSSAGGAGGHSSGYTTASQLEARLAGIAAARTQLIAQRDAVLDERRNGLLIGGVGVIAAFLLRKIPQVLAVAATAVVWGIVKTVSAQATLNSLQEHIKNLGIEQRRIREQLDDL